MQPERILNRLMKYSNAVIDFTFYVRDANGNILSTYSYSENSKVTLPLITQNLKQNEVYLFGSTRLGSMTVNRNVELTTQIKVTIKPIPVVGAVIKFSFVRGIKQYELANHLGNVLVTISDKKIGVDANSDGVIDYYNADVVTANDCYHG